MNSPSSLAPEAACSEPHCSASDPSATSSATPTAKRSSKRAFVTAFLILPRSSGTFESFSRTDGPTAIEGWLTWLREASLASPTASPGSNSEPRIPATCGPKPQTFFAEYDRHSRSWKTCQASLLPDTSEEFSETWPSSGSMRSGRCEARQTSARHTFGSGCGFSPSEDLWPTPTAQDSKNDAGPSTQNRNTLPLNAAVKLWASPRAEDSQCAGLRKSRGTADTLYAQVVKDGGSETPQTPGSLNPSWVEWLMGWPVGWSDLEPLETGKFRRWWLAHGGSW